MKQKHQSQNEAKSIVDNSLDPADLPVTFKPLPEERNGGEKLSAYLAFVPIDYKELSQTRFEAFFINDSNYYMRFTYFSAEGNSWQFRATAEVEPNTKLFVEEFGREQLSQLECVAVQVLSYKRDKPFIFKPTVDVVLRIDGVKFYKLHTFQNNEFFEQPALLYTIVVNDRQTKYVNVNPQELKQHLFQMDKAPTPTRPLIRKSPKKDGPLVVDLHADEILETTKGLEAIDILNYQLDVFRHTLNEHAKAKGAKIVFIHGKGEGVLRQALINDLRYRYKQYTYQDASFLEYGYGATQVTIK